MRGRKTGRGRQPRAVRILDNEGKACDAAVRCLELRSGVARSDVRHPERGRIAPPVDLRLRLGAREYAIEHTLIEPYDNHIKAGVAFKEIIAYVNASIDDALPRPAYYELHVPIDVRLPNRKAERGKALAKLVDWIVAGARTMEERNAGRRVSWRSPRRSDDHVKGAPAHFNCEIELLRWPDSALIRRRPGHLVMRPICPDRPEERRRRRLERAFSRKCPKLHACKAEGARTVLVLESGDIALTRFDLFGSQLPAVLAERLDAPDDIFLVETGIDPWWVWRMKQDDDHWPAVGMPEWNRCVFEADTTDPRYAQVVPGRAAAGRIVCRGFGRMDPSHLRCKRTDRPGIGGWSLRG